MRVCAKNILIALAGILIILYILRNPVKEGFASRAERERQNQNISEGFQSPADVPLPVLQAMFWQAGCRRVLQEGDVWWWRKQANLDIIQNDMNAYARITRACSGAEWQHELCDPGKCGCGWK